MIGDVTVIADEFSDVEEVSSGFGDVNSDAFEISAVVTDDVKLFLCVFKSISGMFVVVVGVEIFSSLLTVGKLDVFWLVDEK